jgi:hypothetical protein
MPNWIKRDVLDEILQATEPTQDRTTNVFYITSKGGEGKTVLLRQVGLSFESPDGIAPKPPFSGILDLYHSSINSNSGIEEHLSKVFGTGDEFEEFRNEREIFDARRKSGMVGLDLETERQKMAHTFARCINKISQWTRPVVALDTTERIQYEIDEIQKECHIQSETTTVREWLTTQIRLWENCVVLLVGRPEKNKYLENALKDTLFGLRNVRYNHIELGGFNSNEADAYFEAARNDNTNLQYALDPEFCQRLLEVTEGRPIRLELALEIVRNGYQFDKFYNKVCSDSPGEIKKEIDNLLVQHIFSDEQNQDIKKILRFLAISRKGLDANLLFYLTKTGDIGQWQDYLDKISERFYVKIHPEEKRLFLHDEMYQFCDEHLIRPEEAQKLSNDIVKWYDKRIHQITETLNNQDKDKKEKEDKKIKELKIESLIYRLRANPDNGYHWYVKEAEFAIRGVEVGYDLRLRNELIAFLKSGSSIDRQLLQNSKDLQEEFRRDSAANWVKRLGIRGDHERAIKVYQQIQHFGKGFFGSSIEGILSRADLELFTGQAFIYTGKNTQALEILNNLISELELGRPTQEVAKQYEDKEYLQWRQNLILGRAHNNLGYIHWMNLWHLNKALKEFVKALPYFNVSMLTEELANTYDNMGRVHTILRQQTRAESLVEEALQLRKEMGREYRIALSKISRAIVCLEFNEPHRSLKLAQQAFQTCEELKAKRGEGLAKIVIGRVHRSLSKLRPDLYSHSECEMLLSDAARYIGEAKRIFSEEVLEPVRVIEAGNELGCIYRERALVAKEQEKPLYRGISSEAVNILKETIELAKNNLVWYIDTCEDLAEVYVLRSEYDLAEHWLDLAEEKIPEVYKLQKGKLNENQDFDRIELLWEMLGKIEKARGDMLFDQETQSRINPERDIIKKVLGHYMLSTTYFDLFSERSPGLKQTFQHIYNQIKRLSYDEQQYLAQTGLREIAEEIHIDLRRFKDFYEGTIGLIVTL